MIPCRISKDYAYYLKQQGVYSDYIAKLKKYGRIEAQMIFFGKSQEERKHWKDIYNGYFEFLLKKYGSPKNVYN